MVEHVDDFLVVEELEDRRSGEDERLTGQEEALGLGVGGDAGFRGGVARAYVFGEGAGDEVTDFGMMPGVHTAPGHGMPCPYRLTSVFPMRSICDS